MASITLLEMLIQLKHVNYYSVYHTALSLDKVYTEIKTVYSILKFLFTI